MNLPTQFEEMIKSFFKEEGKKWLEELPQILETLQKQWQLSNIQIVDSVSLNYVAYVESKQYGKAILKVGFPHRDLFSEMNAVRQFREDGICKCYAIDEEKGALLLERLLPGKELVEIESFKDRLEIASGIISKMPIKIKGTPDEALLKLPDMLDRAFTKIKKDGKKRRLIDIVEKVEKLFEEIQILQDSDVLIHGDLHHWNILKCQTQWKSIDPKGVLTKPCMESARYIRNEMEILESTGKELEKYLPRMLETFSEAFDVSVRIIAIAYLVDLVLGTCWSCEGADVKEEEINKAIKRSEDVYNYIQKEC